MAELAEMAEAAPGRLPGPGPLLAGQVRYQALLLLRSPRAMWAGVLLAIASGAVTVTVGVVVYHAQLTPGGAVSLLLALGLAALAWAGVGTAMTAVIPTADAAQPLLAFTYFPVMLLSGVLAELGGLPPWLATALRYLPGQPTVDAATRALQAGAAVSVPLRDLAVLAAWAVVALLVSLRTFRWEPRAAR